MMNTATGIDAVVNDDLRCVGATLTDLPRARSHEIVQELGEHIREAREDGVVVTEADARNLVESTYSRPSTSMMRLPKARSR
jgi:hypothetical protein